MSLVHDREAARDLAHDVIIKVLTNIKKLKTPAALPGWINVITHNQCMNYLSKAGRLRTEELDEEKAGELFTTEDDELAAKLLLEIQLDQLKQLFTKLNDSERVILLMRYKEGMKIGKIAIVLEMKVSAVKMRLKRSRDHLAELFKSLGDE